MAPMNSLLLYHQRFHQTGARRFCLRLGSQHMSTDARGDGCFMARVAMHIGILGLRDLLLRSVPFQVLALSMSTSQKLPNLAPWPVSSTGRTVLSILQVFELIVCPATRSFGIVIALNHSTRQQTDVANRR